jgi:hypothetical protein
MTGNQVQRYLRTEGLYQEIIDMVCPDVLKEKGETYVRGKLDALLALGKIEGRLSAAEQNTFIFADNDRLIEDWQRIVDGA